MFVLQYEQYYDLRVIRLQILMGTVVSILVVGQKA